MTAATQRLSCVPASGEEQIPVIGAAMQVLCRLKKADTMVPMPPTAVMALAGASL